MAAPQSPLLLALFVLFLCLPTYVQPLLSYGCSLNEILCEANESCYSDGLFGECAGEDQSPLVLNRPLDEVQSELLRLELTRLVSEGYDWQNARTQCVLAYFKLSIAFQLQYDANFCAVRNPNNVWALLQVVKETLSAKKVPMSDIVSNEELPVFEAVPNRAIDKAALSLLAQPPFLGDDRATMEADFLELPLTNEEEDRLSEYVDDVLAEKDPDLTGLSDIQLERLSKYVQFLKNVLLNQQEGSEVRSGEAEEAVPLNVEDDGNLPLKKDIEHLGDQNTGLEKIEHKIVKGAPPLERVDGNRVYLKVTKDMTDEQLFQLIRYLNLSIATPNKLIFDQFEYSGEQLSFRVSRATLSRSRNEKRLDSVEGIAEAVYKRRKDIETLSGVRVDETGIGSGDGAVPVEREESDGLFTPILLICAFTICALATVLAAHQIKQRQRYRRAAALPELAEQIEGKPSTAYQDLCRHRMSTQETNSGSGSKNSSTSSWCEEPVTHANMDISTGHVILTFLQEYLQNPSKIEEQWSMLKNYSNPNCSFSIAIQEHNMDKNRNPNCLPYDDTLISIQSSASDLTSSVYINASAIHDSDPRQANYIATQSPLPNTIASFWQMIWEQGAVLIVNLAGDQDLTEDRCTRYWPENGSQLHGVYEIHLVSEHIWSEDYLVRSFYLKNLKTNETRTITQFHYLTWPQNGVPASSKALLEFRRKVNKSYRGRAAPIVVHCTDGTGRTGTYCLIDMVLNRVAKGVKELNIAGSLEHLRDQRNGLVESEEQYKMVFSCLAEEVTAMVKALPR